MTLKADIEEAQRTHDMHQILGTNKKIMVCPLPSHVHSSNTPSFSIFWKDGIQRFRCHGNCGLVGDVIDLIGYLHIPGYNRSQPGMVKKALKYMERKVEIAVPIPVKEVKLTGSEWFDMLPISPEAREYAHTRGLNDDTIQKFNLGSKPDYLSLPCFEDGRLVGIKLRKLTPGNPRYLSVKGSIQGLFNFDRVAYSTKTVFIVKAEIPCMLLDQLGFLACSPTGGEGGWDERWRGALALSRNIVIGDNDAPGKKLGQRRALILGAELVFPDERFKDIDEVLLAEPEATLKQLKEWSEM